MPPRSISRNDGPAQHVSVVFEPRPEGGWIARLGERPGIVAEGGSIAQARKRLAQRIARDARDLAKRTPRERILLPRSGRDAIDGLDRARADLIAAERDAVVALVRGLGITVADASSVLGLSMRRIVHLAGEVADAEAEKKHARRVLARPAAARTTRGR